MYVKFILAYVPFLEDLELILSFQSCINPCRLWDCLAIENSNVTRSCVGLLLECIHYLAHNPHPAPPPTSTTSSTSNGGAATNFAKHQPRQQYSQSSSAPSGYFSLDAEGGGDVSGASVATGGSGSEGAMEDLVLWKILKKGLTAPNWITKFKTGLSSPITYLYMNILLYRMHSIPNTISLSLSFSFYPTPISLSLSLSIYLPSLSVPPSFLCLSLSPSPLTPLLSPSPSLLCL